MRTAVILVLVLHATIAQAQTKSTTTSSSSTQAGSTQFDSAERSAAQHWGLTVEDYRRYQALMKGVRGALSDPRISPVEVLGIHARDEAERRKYAEMFARLMADDTQRVLQFQLEYDRAFRRLNPKLAVLDLPDTARTQLPSLAAAPQGVPQPVSATVVTPAPAMSRPAPALSGDRLLVFARHDCKACDEAAQRALALVRQGVTVDLYVVDARSAEDAQRYARHLGLDPALLGDRRVTLNIDGGTFTRVLPHQRDLPALVRKRGESLVQLAATEL